MAEVKPGSIGIVNGKVGDYVFRRMNGKIFVSLRPDSYKVSQSKAAKQSRSGFAASVSFAKFLSRIPEIAEVWRSAPVAGTSPYHRLIKYNNSKTESGQLSAYNLITPEGVIYPFKEVNFNLNSAAVLLDPIAISKEYKHIGSFKVVLLISMCEPINTGNKQMRLKHFVCEVNIDKEQEFLFTFSEYDKSLFAQHKKIIIYLAAVWTNNEEKIQWSNTFAKEFINKSV